MIHISSSAYFFPPSSQNQRFAGYEIPGDEQPRIYTTENSPSPGEIEEEELGYFAPLRPTYRWKWQNTLVGFS